MGYARLARPANLPTAAADIFAGIAIAIGVNNQNLETFFTNNIFNSLSLILASVLLYAGGVVLNDVFDAKIDKIERPERAIPSGLIPLKSAAVYGVLLLLLGLLAAFSANVLSGIIACVLVIAIVLYDAFSKNNEFIGPLNMGICRGLNLILGMSVLNEVNYWWYALVPVIYIFAITLISRGEVHGNNKRHIIWAGLLYAVVLFFVLSIIMFKTNMVLKTIPFLLLFMFLIYRPLLKAYKLNSPSNIKKAVIAGVLSIIVLDASLATSFTNWQVGIVVVMLFPLSILLSKLFAVT